MKKKTYSVVWHESFAVNVEAKDEAEAIEMIHSGDYDESGVSGQVSVNPEAYEIKISIGERLEELRQAIRNENISYGEIAELQGLAKHIDKSDVELLEVAGVPETN